MFPMVTPRPRAINEQPVVIQPTRRQVIFAFAHLRPEPRSCPRLIDPGDRTLPDRCPAAWRRGLNAGASAAVHSATARGGSWRSVEPEPRLDRRKGVGIGVVGRQHQHARGDAEPGQLVDRGQPVHARHAQVHQDHVGPELLGEPYGCGAVRGLAQHLESGCGGEHAAQPIPDDGMVVRDHYRIGVSVTGGRGSASSMKGVTSTIVTPRERTPSIRSQVSRRDCGSRPPRDASEDAAARRQRPDRRPGAAHRGGDQLHVVGPLAHPRSVNRSTRPVTLPAETRAERQGQLPAGPRVGAKPQNSRKSIASVMVRMIAWRHVWVR